MTTPRKAQPDPAVLRSRAAEKLAARTAVHAKLPQEPDATRLLHELEVHQIELEIQNDELLQVRDELEAGLSRYTELFDFAPLGYVLVDGGFVIQELNHAAADLFGTERGRLVNQVFSALVSEDDRDKFAILVARTRMSEKRESAELTLLRSGVCLPARLTAKALPGLRLGAHLRILLAIEDITERRAHELRIATTESALREADRRKDEFIAILSHELRNPLTPIRNCVFILGSQTTLEAPAQHALAIVERQVSHLTHLIDDLLDVTRVGRGKIQLKLERLELRELVRRVLDDHQNSFEQSGIELESRITTQALWVYADAVRITQVLSNLLGNAEKFTPRGGRVAVSLAPEGSQIVLRVIDNGAGIAPELIGHLFEPFTQAPQTLARARGGLGLGLSMVKGLVELHGGTVTIASPGAERGTELTVRLPLDLTPTARKEVESAAPARSHRVLIIEDNEDAADTLGHALTLLGHDVQVAYEGPSGLELAHSFHPHVVFCDIGLPGMDGYDVARAIRSDLELRSVYLVALTGYAQPEDLARAADAGFDQHVAKPPNVGALNRLIAEAATKPTH